MSAEEKSSEKPKKVLDKPPNLWYNKDTNKGCDLPPSAKRRKEHTMTTREYFTTVLNAHLSDEMDKASELLIAKLDDRNAKRKSADSKAKKETAARRQIVLDFLAENRGKSFTRDEIAAAVEMDAAKVTGALTPLVKDGIVTKATVKVDKAKRMAYTIA